MKSSSILISTFVAVIALGATGAYVAYRVPRVTRTRPAAAAAGSNVTTVDGTQIVAIDVRGGYQPESSTVSSEKPVTLRFATRGTFDCSSSIRIPSLGISRTLPATGSTDIPLGTLPPGTLEGTCGMGMYRFSVVVK